MALNVTLVALWIAAVSTVLLVVLSVRQGGGSMSKSGVRWASLFIGAVGAAVAWQAEALGPWRVPLTGLLAGFAAAIALLDFPDGDRPASLGAPIGLAAVIIGVWSAEAKGQPLLALGFLVGAGAAAAILAISQRALAAVAFVAVAAVGMAAMVLGSTLNATEGVLVTVNVLTVALLALLVGEAFRAVTKKSKLGWPDAGTALAFGALAFFVTNKSTTFPDLPLVVAGTALIAVALAVVTRGDAGSTFSSIVGSVVWLGVASAAFSFGKGYGMAVAGLVAVLASLLAGERRAVALTSPIIALSLYRLARFLYPDFSRAFDIGQHYALVGLVLGILLPLLLLEWGRNAASGKPWPTAVAAVCAGLAALVSTSFAVAFLDDKGASGLAIGFALSPALAVLKGAVPKTALSTGLALSGWTVVSIGVFSNQDVLARPDKVRLLPIIGGVIVGLAVLAWFLTRSKKGIEE